MTFQDSYEALTLDEILTITKELKLTLPSELVSLYLDSNGGVPEPYVFEDENIDTVVVEFFPLKSNRIKRTAVSTYGLLVQDKKIVGRNFFPFAIDGGGDYFFVDCTTEKGLVHFYKSDRSANFAPLIPLGVGVKQFWDSLKPED